MYTDSPRFHPNSPSVVNEASSDGFSNFPLAEDNRPEVEPAFLATRRRKIQCHIRTHQVSAGGKQSCVCSWQRDHLMTYFSQEIKNSESTTVYPLSFLIMIRDLWILTLEDWFFLRCFFLFSILSLWEILRFISSLKSAEPKCLKMSFYPPSSRSVRSSLARHKWVENLYASEVWRLISLSVDSSIAIKKPDNNLGILPFLWTLVFYCSYFIVIHTWLLFSFACVFFPLQEICNYFFIFDILQLDRDRVNLLFFHSFFWLPSGLLILKVWKNK